MDELREFFKEEKYNDTTLSYIFIFAREFDELFGKYVSREEVLKRIKENLNFDIEFVEKFHGDTVGTYDRNEKKIKLKSSLDEEQMKSVFFHEMVHCLTAHGEYTGFARKYSTEAGVSIITATGLTEGFTQFVTQKRDERFNFKKKGRSYPILTDLTKSLADIIGEDVFLDVAFNYPEKLTEMLEESKLNLDFMDCQHFLENFDIIKQNEKNMLMSRKILIFSISEDNCEDL